jgi:hypothetical protein
VKQLDPARSQLVQKPFALSFQIPTFDLPDCARACRVILPSDVKVIVNLVPLGEAAVNGRPLKNVVFMSLGAIDCPAKAVFTLRTNIEIANDVARIETPTADLCETSSTNIHRRYDSDHILQISRLRQFLVLAHLGRAGRPAPCPLSGV